MYLRILSPSFCRIISSTVALAFSGVFSSATSIISSLQYLPNLLLYSAIASFRYFSLIFPTVTNVIFISLFLSYLSTPKLCSSISTKIMMNIQFKIDGVLLKSFRYTLEFSKGMSGSLRLFFNWNPSMTCFQPVRSVYTCT